MEDGDGKLLPGGVEGDVADAEVGGVEEAGFEAGGIEEEDAADGVRFHGVKQSASGGGGESGEYNGGIRLDGLGGRAREHGSPALGFPGVAAVNGGGALADLAGMVALDRLGGAVLADVQLALG